MSGGEARTVRRRARDRWGRRGLFALMALYVGGLLVAPVVAITWGALSRGPLPFLAALVEGGAAHALFLSLALAAVAVAVNTCFGTVLALVLCRDRFRGRNLMNAVVDLPLAISPVIVGFTVILLFGRQGWLAPLAHASGVPVVFAWPGMALVTIFVSLPFVVREVGLVLDAVGDEQEEVAYTLGAGPVITFFRVTLPNIRWGLLYGVLLTTARALGEFGAILVVSGGIAHATETGTLFVFRSLDDRRDLAAYSMSVALAAMSVALLLAMELLKRRRAAVEAPGNGRKR